MSNLQAARETYKTTLKAALKDLETEGRVLKKEYDDNFVSLKKRHAAVQMELDRLDKATTAVASPVKKAAPKKVAKKAPKKPAKAKVAAKKVKAKAAAKTTAKKAPKKVAAKAKGKTKGKTAKKAAKKSTKSKAAAIAAATKGRRAVAEGLRPPLKEAIATVMGKTTMDAGQVIDGLKKRSWMPDAEDERGYISYALSSNKSVFERVQRGQYKVRAGVTFSKWTPKKKAAGKKAAAKTTAAKAVAPPVSAEGQQALTDIGVGANNNIEPNPFLNA